MRCGEKRTRDTIDGVPTCDECQIEIKLERESRRNCPLDGTEMVKIIHYNVVIDKCPTCKGHWLDPGELKLLQTAVAQADNNFASGFIMGMIIG